MDKQSRTYQAYVQILKEELIPAMGCTEPIAIAYAAAQARDVLGGMPDKVEIGVSSNIIKNVKSVIVPNTDGMKGIEAAAAAGIVGGQADIRQKNLYMQQMRWFPVLMGLIVENIYFYVTSLKKKKIMR